MMKPSLIDAFPELAPPAPVYKGGQREVAPARKPIPEPTEKNQDK